MTDEQWLWLFVNQLIDTDEQLEKMCGKCKDEVVSDNKKCIKCGCNLDHDDECFKNPSFDSSRFDTLSNGGTPEKDSDIDLELSKRIMEVEDSYVR